MRIDCNNKIKISKSYFTINWSDKFLKIRDKDSYSNEIKHYRIYYEDLENCNEEKNI